MKEDALRVFLLDRWPSAETQHQKEEHRSPRIEKDPENQDYE
jgi:hypothetical protein